MGGAPTGDRDELAATLALAEVPGIGSARLRTLLAACGGARAALASPHALLARLPGFTRAAATAIRECRVERGLRILAELDRLGAEALLAGDERFPAPLRAIPDTPAVLYVWGDVTLLDRPAVAIVGSRRHSPYGAEAARILARGVAPHAVVVSGMARGIDAIAHAAALDAGGASVGVLGNGFGVIYPAANRALYARMAARGGCLVTELPPGERPHAGAFPRRNRIVSGLAGATVVVEAAATSGALITADCALDQGRAVLAVPGPITSALSVGANRLIQQGAKPALSAADVLEEIGIVITRDTVAVGAGPPALPGDLDGLERALCEALDGEPRLVDDLVTAAAAPAPAVLAALTGLELRGLVVQQAGGRFTLRA